MKKEEIFINGKVKSRMTSKDVKECNECIEKIVKEIKGNLSTSCEEVVHLSENYMAKKKEKRLEMLLFIHREVLKYLLLYPIKHIFIGDKSKKKLLGGRTSFIYNMALAKHIIDTEMVESGASEQLAEAIYKASNKMKPKREDLSYIG